MSLLNLQFTSCSHDAGMLMTVIIDKLILKLKYGRVSAQDEDLKEHYAPAKA